MDYSHLFYLYQLYVLIEKFNVICSIVEVE